jgi:hypothetical protein
MSMHCLTYSIGLDAAVIDFVISLSGEPNAESGTAELHGLPWGEGAQIGPSG